MNPARKVSKHPVLHSFIDNFSTIGHLDTDSPEVKVKKSFLVFLATFMSAGGVLWWFISIYNGLVGPSLFPLGYIMISIVNIAYFYSSKDFRTVRFIQVFISLTLPFLYQWSIGGFFSSGSILLWSVLALIASLTFQRTRTAVIWLCVFLVGVIISGVFQETIAQNKPEILPEQSSLFLVLNIVIITVIVFALVLYFVGRQNMIQKKLYEASEEAQQLNAALQRNLFEKNKAIDELKLTWEQLIESEKMASMGILTAGLAHELNNPLNIIGGVVDPIRKDLNDLRESVPEDNKSKMIFEELEDLLEDISQASNRATSVIRNLLKNSPKNNGQEENKGELINLKELIDSSMSLIIKGNENVNFDIQLSNHLNVKGNSTEINQVILNIVRNSLEAIGDKGSIKISGWLETDKIKICIEDNGPGIPEHISQKIFEPFFTTKGPGNGTGLGLYISSIIIKKHHGSIKLRNKKYGTKFQITLPAIREDNVRSFHKLAMA